MQPYHKAAEAIRSGQEAPIQMLKNAGLTALGGGVATAGGKALGKLIPAVGALINKYVPDNLLQKGLSKIDPRFGQFIQGALDEGYSHDDIREFLGDKIEKTQGPKENRNIIEQYSPELHQFIDQEIKSGMTPLQAGAKASVDKKFTDAIKKITTDHKLPWSSLLETVYGQNEKSQSQQKEPQQPQPMQPMQPMQPQAQQQQGGGQGAQALQAILQKINQRLGG